MKLNLFSLLLTHIFKIIYCTPHSVSIYICYIFIIYLIDFWLQIPFPNVALFVVKSPSIIQRSDLKKMLLKRGKSCRVFKTKLWALRSLRYQCLNSRWQYTMAYGENTQLWPLNELSTLQKCRWTEITLRRPKSGNHHDLQHLTWNADYKNVCLLQFMRKCPSHSHNPTDVRQNLVDIMNTTPGGEGGTQWKGGYGEVRPG